MKKNFISYEKKKKNFHGYIPQLFAWSVVVKNFLQGATASKVDSFGEKRQMPTFVYGIVFGEMLIFWCFGVVQLSS